MGKGEFDNRLQIYGYKYSGDFCLWLQETGQKVLHSLNSFKLQHGRFSLDIGKNCLKMMAVKHWNRIPGETTYIS